MVRAPEDAVLAEEVAEEAAERLRAEGCGRRVGRYTLLRRIASGGMAEVYLARGESVPGFEKRVALKKILPQHAHNERFVDMLLDEAKITVRLAHPNIAQVFELGLEGESFFIVMEHVPGPPLSAVLRRVDERAGGAGTLPVSHAVFVASEVLKGLAHAHGQTDGEGRPLGIVHRDVSPQNVLVAYDGAVKLIDFGIARAENRLAETHHGVIKGKLRYLAPEIAAGDEPDHRADIFCAGILLFELLTGEALYAPRSDFEAIEMATRAKVRSPRAVNPAVPVELERLVMGALARDPEDRPASALELQEDLRRFLNRHDPSFVESDLRALMQDFFREEIRGDRDLDRQAEVLAASAIAEGTEPSPSTSAYQQLVTSTFVLDRARRGDRPASSPEPEAPRATGPSDEPETETGEGAAPRRSRRADRFRLAAGVALVVLAGWGAFALSRPGASPGTPIAAGLGSERGRAEENPARAGEAPDPGASASRAVEAPRTEGADPAVVEEKEAEPRPPPERRESAAPERAPRPEARVRRRRGTLLVNSRPPSVVYVDGRKIGRTPVRARLDAGRHRIVLRGPGGARKVMKRYVRAGREDQLIYRWP